MAANWNKKGEEKKKRRKERKRAGREKKSGEERREDKVREDKGRGEQTEQLLPTNTIAGQLCGVRCASSVACVADSCAV